MKARLLLLPLFLLAFTAISCEGPEGPAGEPGQVEVFSVSLTIDDSDFSAVDDIVSVADYTGFNFLTESTVDNGLVLGYIRFDGEFEWHALPFTVPFDSDVVVLRYSFDIDLFTLILEGEVAGNNDANEALFDGDVLRVVAIPPGQVFKAKIDYQNYNEVAEFYGLTN